MALADGSLLAAHECGTGPDLCLAELGAGEPRLLEPLSARSELVTDPAAELSSPSMDARGDRLALAALQIRETAAPRLLFFLMDRAGTVLREHALPLPPDAFRFRPFDTVHLLRTEGGWLVMFSRRDAVVSGPTNHEPDTFYYGSATHLRRHPAGGFVLSGLRAPASAATPDEEQGYIAYLGPDGGMRWEIPVRDLDMAIALDDGRIFAIINPGLRPNEANPLDVVEIRCAPI